MRLPCVGGVLSDATKLGWDDLDSSVAKLLFQPVIVDNFANLSAWTEVDSGSNVNLSAGVISINGNASYAANGVYLTAGVARASGYFELKIQAATALVAVGILFGVNNSAALPSAAATASTVQARNSTGAIILSNGTASNGGTSPIVANTYYTFKLYIGLSADGSTWGFFKVTISGGAYATETELGCFDSITTGYAATVYPYFQRNTNSASNLTQIKEFRWYSGYATDGPYVTYTHDAGAGKTFDNLDLTNLAMPSGVASTNLKFDYYFGDDSGGALTGTWRTLAQLNAVGEVAGRYRYIKIAVQSNSDGATQAYAAKPNADDATAGCGDFPEVSNVLTTDTVQLVEGTATTGSLTVPAVPTWGTTPISNIGSTKQRITWAMSAITGGPAATYELSSNGSTADIATGIVALNYLRTGLTAASTYSYYVRARNDAGASAWSAVASEETDATRAIAASISRDLVTAAASITTANGYNTNVVAAEMERQTERINNRLPMIEVCGPAVNISATKHSGGDMYELEYALIYKANLNDDDLNTTPVTVQTENVAADIIKAIMADHTRGGNAIITRPTDYFHTLDTTGQGMNMFTVVVTFQVETIIDYKNPYLIG